MGTDHKEKLIRVLQILDETDEKSPMNATQILKYLEEEYQIWILIGKQDTTLKQCWKLCISIKKLNFNIQK